MDRNEAIKIVKNHYPANKYMLNEALEFLIPELKESEDEKIRKFIIHELACIRAGEFVGEEISDRYKELNNAISWLEKQSEEQPIIRWRNINEEPEEMKELFCEWESDDATWHDVAFYDKESHTFRHAKIPINVTKWIYVDELLKKQDKQKETLCDKCRKEQPSHFCQDITELGRCAVEKQRLISSTE